MNEYKIVNPRRKKVLLVTAVVIILVTLVVTGLSYRHSQSSSGVFELDAPIMISEGLGILGGEIGAVYGTTGEVLTPGAKGAARITVVNGPTSDRLINVSLVSPCVGCVKEGFEPFPPEYFGWITLSPTVFTLSRNGNQVIDITLAMPGDSTYLGKKAEVRILVQDVAQSGFAQIAVEAKWYIITSN